MTTAKEIRDNLDTAVATELGVPIEEARELVGAALGTLAGQPLPEVPWETRRKSVKPPKHAANHDEYYRDHAHEVWKASNGWTYYLLKDNQKDRTKDYASGFFLVDGWATDLGDTYWADVTKYARRVR